ncbi:two-component system response regulator [Marinoscillum sp. 108]|uniref:Two-component system response regulator n=1 Tax=Marinoscillum luteum TaxID=861051 RepID=A0ABW7N5E4_9BACT|nr:response regulator [Marinoscillum sp. 108]VXD13266.1 Response regulator receiver domain-containing protein [Marinoscillum sp. 108]
MKKLKCVLLIDDDKDCNFLQKRTILRSTWVEYVEVARNGEMALEILKKAKFTPELIFLDINMPKMNGWEFLNELKKIKDTFEKKIVVIMLSSSLNPDDRVLAETYDIVGGFQSKYLDEASLKQILVDHFPTRFDFQQKASR